MANNESSEPREIKGSYSSDTVPAGKPLRADARRNRERILDVATKVFATEGVEVPVDEIAQRAGMGIGTLYRHFPTKEDLIDAVVFSFKQRLIGKAREMLEQEEPEQAFFSFLSLIVTESSGNKALIAALARPSTDVHESLSGISRDFQHALRELLDCAQRASAVRADIQVTDITAMLFGIMRTLEYNDHSGSTQRIFSVICDGLRVRQ